MATTNYKAINTNGNTRLSIIDTIGREYLTENIEGGEFSYKQVLSEVEEKHFKLDLRFYNPETNTAVLVETKKNKVTKKNKEQLFTYVHLEQQLSERTRIIAILASITQPDIMVWKIADGIEEHLDDTVLKSFGEYVNYFKETNINDMSTVLTNTSKLNGMLHDNGIKEYLRSQFVGTCLLALKNGLVYKNLSTKQILEGIKETLGNLLEGSVDKAEKIAILSTNVLQNDNVYKIKASDFENLLNYINKNIKPYIDEASTEGQDILSYFFTTFNKYTNREDKNQAFTPNHIAHFMCSIGNITRNTRVLDPTCGSGTFLVQAMAQALAKCDTDEERQCVKQEQIYGIEYDDKVFGLSTTNMLIHGDGNSNIIMASCFDKKSWIQDARPDLVLMNPPYNANKKQVTDAIGKTWGKSTSTDPSKGLGFVQYIADTVGSGRLLTLLPMQCAIGTKDQILSFKKALLKKHTLDAVFSLPGEMFYPGASAVACCMVFDLGKPHKDTNRPTFFGYFKDDGFEKRKGVGRVDVNNRWEDIEKLWLSLYEHRETRAGLSVCQQVLAKDEWCAEAYMETDYSQLRQEHFQQTLNDYLAYLVRGGQSMKIDTSTWRAFTLDSLFEIRKGKRLTSADQTEGNTPYIGAINANNGESNRIGQIPIHEGNTISLSYNGSVGEAFYQPHPFWATDDVNVLYFRKENGLPLNRYIAAFICTLLKMERFKYNYGRKWTLENMRSAEIKLPVIGDRPDWAYMEKYIRSLHSEVISTQVAPEEKELNLGKWQWFTLEDLFTIKAGYYHYTYEYSEGETPYCSATAENNGIKERISLEAEFPSGRITIGKVGCEAFYQPEPFCATSDVNVLTPRFEINKYIGMFIVAVINMSENYKWNYGRQCRVNDSQHIRIKLPVTDEYDKEQLFSSNGYMPDWQYMEDYIKSLPYGDRI